MTENKISSDKIVSPSPRVLPSDHPFLVFYDPNKVLIDDKTKSGYKTYTTGMPFENVSGTTDATNQKHSTDATIDKAKLIDLPDVPQPSDIQVYTPLTPVYDPVTKALTYKIVLKVRNSSKNKDNVGGVDARIVGTEQTA